MNIVLHRIYTDEIVTISISEKIDYMRKSSDNMAMLKSEGDLLANTLYECLSYITLKTLIEKLEKLM